MTINKQLTSDLRARVFDVVSKRFYVEPDELTDAVLAAIPEPALIVPRVEIGGVYVTWSAPNNFTVHQFGRDWITPSAVGIVNYYLTGNVERDEKVVELLALRDGPDAKDAQIAALKDEVEQLEGNDMLYDDVVSSYKDEVAALNIECLERAGTALALTEQVATLTQRAEAAEAEVKSVRNAWREVAALTAKAGTPTWWVNMYKDGSGTAHCTEKEARHEAFSLDAEYPIVARPVYEAPPTPAEYPVIGACVVKDGLMQVDYTYPLRTISDDMVETMCKLVHPAWNLYWSDFPNKPMIDESAKTKHRTTMRAALVTSLGNI